MKPRGFITFVVCAFVAFSFAYWPDAARISNSAEVSHVPDHTYPDDGYANAPRAPIQRPILLAGYTARAPWKVAGVDYAVGIPAGTVLTDWQNLKGPGISMVGNMVRIDNTNGVRISNVDFSLHGGANLYINNSNDTVVTNCKFQSYTTADIIQFAGSSSGLTVNYSDITGGSNGSGLIGATGNVVVQYNWMNNFPQHAVELYGSASLDMRYNLIENGGTVSGSHLNYVQPMGVGITDLLVEFNTTYQTPQAASGEGFQFDINDGTIWHVGKPNLCVQYDDCDRWPAWFGDVLYGSREQ